MSSIQIKNGKLSIFNFETDDPEILEYFKDTKTEDLEQRFKFSLKVGIIALKAVGTTERVDYIQKEFNKLDTKFNEILQGTADKLSENVESIFGDRGTLPSMLKENFGENGKVNSLMENHLGEKGTFAEQLEKHFGKNGLIVKELFDPLRDGTPLNQLKTIITEELRSIKQTLEIDKATEELKQKSTQKGKEFEDECEELLGNVVSKHIGDELIRTSDIKGQITGSKKGDFVVKVNGKTEYSIVIEAKDWGTLSLPKIQQELEEALENRAAKFGILVTKWTDSLPSSVGCFNCFNDNKIVCGLGSKDDEVLHEEILHVAYCWARTQMLKKSTTSTNVDFEFVDSNLIEIKKQLDTFSGIKRQCKNINDASKVIADACEELKSEIQTCLLNIQKELDKEAHEATIT